MFVPQQSALKHPSSLLLAIIWTKKQLLSLFPFACLGDSSILQFDLDVENFFEHYDESERRELVRMSTEIYRKLSGLTEENIEDFKKILEQFIILILAKDQDWESKRLAVDFWRLCYKNANNSGAWRTGLVLGCEDYEASVRLVFRQLVTDLGLADQQPSAQVGHKRRINNESGIPAKLAKCVLEKSLDEETKRVKFIDNLLEEPYQEQLEHVLKRREETRSVFQSWVYPQAVSAADFSLWLEEVFRPKEECLSPQSKLQAVLEDILYSSSDSNMIELVDCY